MTTAAAYQAKVTKSVTNMDRLDGIVNGDENTTVAVDSGTVPSLAKVISDMGWEAGDADRAEVAAVEAEGHAATSLAALQALQAGSGQPIVAQLPLEAVTRTALKAITGQTLGRQAFLGEAGRAGVFRWDSANLSAAVTADPYEGLHIAPASDPTGASGAWVRIVEDGTYQARWWGINAAFGPTAHIPTQSALDLLPEGGTLIMPPETVTISSGLLITTPNTHLMGYGPDISKIAINPASPTSFNVVQVATSGATVSYVWTHGKSQQQFAGAPAGILVSREGTGNVSLDPQTGNRVHNVKITGASISLVAYGDPIDGLGVSPIKGFKAWNLEIETDMQGISLFGADDAQIGSFIITFTGLLSPGLVAVAIRILGSKRFNVHDGHCTGNTGYDINDHKGLQFSLGNLGGTSGRRQNEDGVVDNVVFTGFSKGALIEEVLGTCVIRNCKFIRPVSETRSNQGIEVAVVGTSGGVAAAAGHLIFENCVSEGWSIPIVYSGNVKRLTFDRNKCTVNKRTPDGSNLVAAFRSAGGGPRLAEMLGNTFLCPSTVVGRYFVGTGEKFVAAGNLLSESVTPTAPYTGLGFVSGAGTSVIYPTNFGHPVGTHADVTA